MSKKSPQTATKSTEIRPKKPKIRSFWPKRPQAVPKSPKKRSPSHRRASAAPRDRERDHACRLQALSVATDAPSPGSTGRVSARTWWAGPLHLVPALLSRAIQAEGIS